MGKGKKLAIGLSGVLIGGMLLSGGMAFAASSGNSTAADLAGKIPWVGKMMGHRGGIPGLNGGMMGIKGRFGSAGFMLAQENLDNLVKEGTITQAKADEIKAFIDKTLEEKQAKGRQDILSQLVTNGILTQAEADAIMAELKELAQAQSLQKISDSLKALVDQGTITQDQADKILKSCTDAAATREAEIQKIENMTVKEARKYMQDNWGKPQNYLGQLVTDGVITQDQADAFRAAMAEKAGIIGKAGMGGMGGMGGKASMAGPMGLGGRR